MRPAGSVAGLVGLDSAKQTFLPPGEAGVGAPVAELAEQHGLIARIALLLGLRSGRVRGNGGAEKCARASKAIAGLRQICFVIGPYRL